ncbi:MAG: hypothetical protein IPH09_06100 [bacterium]|nr:hypothetical protein [bacterium]
MTAPFARCALIAIACAAAASAAPAAAPWDDDLPWPFLDDERALRVTASRYDDSASGWQLGVLELAAVLRRDVDGVAYLRWPHLDFASGGRTVLERWPDAAGEGATAGWPGERQVAGWGRPAVGYLGRTRVPLAGPLRCGAELALPFAANALYPFAARSLALRVQASRAWRLDGGFTLEAGGGRTLNLGAAGDVLAPAAFPGRGELSAGLAWRPAPATALALAAVRGGGGRDSRRLRLSLEMPLSDEIRLQAGWTREFADAADRLFRDGLFLGLALPGLDAPEGNVDAAP